MKMPKPNPFKNKKLAKVVVGEEARDAARVEAGSRAGGAAGGVAIVAHVARVHQRRVKLDAVALRFAIFAEARVE